MSGLSSGSSSLGAGDIAGIAIGGVFIVVTVVGIAISIYAMCCKKEPKSQVGQDPYRPYGQPQQGPYGQPPHGPYGQQMNTGYYGQQQNPYAQQQSWQNPSYGQDYPPPYQPAPNRATPLVKS